MQQNLGVITQIPALRLRVFTSFMRSLWIVIILLTIASELVPVPVFPPELHYSIKFAKGLLFVLAGYLLPLTFWRFNSLNRGIVFASFSAGLVETLQGVFGNGHSFHWYELLLKVALVLFGFILALDARYERRITMGPLKVALTGECLSD